MLRIMLSMAFSFLGTRFAVSGYRGKYTVAATHAHSESKEASNRQKRQWHVGFCALTTAFGHNAPNNKSKQEEIQVKFSVRLTDGARPVLSGSPEHSTIFSNPKPLLCKICSGPLPCLLAPPPIRGMLRSFKQYTTGCAGTSFFV